MNSDSRSRNGSVTNMLRCVHRRRRLSCLVHSVSCLQPPREIADQGTRSSIQPNESYSDDSSDRIGPLLAVLWSPVAGRHAVAGAIRKILLMAAPHFAAKIPQFILGVQPIFLRVSSAHDMDIAANQGRGDDDPASLVVESPLLLAGCSVHGKAAGIPATDINNSVDHRRRSRESVGKSRGSIGAHMEEIQEKPFA